MSSSAVHHKPQVYDAELKQVLSGDDLFVMVDLGVDDLHKRVRVRLSGVDTPNAIGAAPGSPAHRVSDQVRRMIGRNKLRLHPLSIRGNNSWVCNVEIVTPNGEYINLNKQLIDAGYVFKKVGSEK